MVWPASHQAAKQADLRRLQTETEAEVAAFTLPPRQCAPW